MIARKRARLSAFRRRRIGVWLASSIPDSKLQLERNSMPCDAGRMQLAAELAGQSAG
jgi:hypothetical protein